MRAAVLNVEAGRYQTTEQFHATESCRNHRIANVSIKFTVSDADGGQVLKIFEEIAVNIPREKGLYLHAITVLRRGGHADYCRAHLREWLPTSDTILPSCSPRARLACRPVLQ